jgi:AcrR family transcriptional regulator
VIIFLEKPLMGRRSDHSREELRAMVMTTAERIAEAEGLHGLGARKIMREIGYSIGTFYQLFENLDELIVALNGRTLDELYEECSSAAREGGPETRLSALADHYIRFAREHAKRWSILFEHRLPDGAALPAWHYEKILRLLATLEAAMAPLFLTGQEAERLHTARVLWSSLHGICSLEASNKLAETESVEAMSETLISNFLAGLRVSRLNLDVGADGSAADVTS